MKLIHFVSIIGLGLFSIFPVIKVQHLNDYAIAQSLDAIVPLKNINIPAAKVSGETRINLQSLENSRVFTIPLKVGNLSGNFLLDTGASTTMVSSALVQQLGLVGKPIESEELTSAVAGDDCEDMSAILHPLPQVKMNQVKIEQLQALEFTNTIIPQNLSGVLGMDVLKFFDLKINYKAKKLDLLKPSILPTEQQPDAIKLTNKLGVMLASVTVNRQENLTFMLDTGADLIFISQKLAQQLNLNPAEIEPIQVQGFCGLEDASYSVLQQVKIGKFEQNNLGVVILNSPSVLDTLEIDGIIGQNFFEFYQQYWRFHSDSTSNQWDASLILEPDQN
jgi:predicted aspartyl protease